MAVSNKWVEQLRLVKKDLIYKASFYLKILTFAAKAAQTQNLEH